MSLIKCPECGGDVSSAAQSCVHCGFRFKICSECGTVYSAEAETCPRCGFCENPKPKAVEPKNLYQSESSADTQKIEDRLEKDYTEFQKKDKTKKILGWLEGICTTVSFVVGIVWISKEPLDMLLTRDLCCGFGYAFLIAAAILELVRSIFAYGAQTILWEGAKWFMREKPDAYEFFVRNKINPKDYIYNEKDRYGILTEWAFFAEHPEKFPTERKWWLIDFIITLVKVLMGIAAGLAIFAQAMEYLNILSDNFDSWISILKSTSAFVLYGWLGICLCDTIFMDWIVSRSRVKPLKDWAERYMARKEKERGIAAA